MTDPNQPPPRGRHSQGDADAGRPASELLAAWATAGDTLQDEETMRPRRRRRYAPDTDAAGVQVLPARGAVEVADVEITGLDATGIADVGLAAAGLDVSAFGIDRPEVARRRPVAPKPWSWGAGAIAEPAPRTTEMPAVTPAVPRLAADSAAGRPAGDRRTPAPRPATEPTTADRVAADRFADGQTDPGWVSASGRPSPVAPARQPSGRPAADDPQAPALGSLASLFTDAPGADLHPGHPSAPVDLPTEAHAAFGAGGFWAAEDEPGRSPLSRHRNDEPADENDDYDDYDELDDVDELGNPLDGPVTVADHTGGLEVFAADDQDYHDDEDDEDDEHLLDGVADDGGRGRRGGRGGGAGRPRRRRRPITIALSLIVLVGLVAGIAVGGRTLWNTIHPAAEDYSGSGTGSVDIRVDEGDSLRTIAGTLVGADVIASSGPFTDAAKANPAATGIQPGLYTLHRQMSGKAALDLLLDPSSRQLSRVTLPEGLTVTQVLQRLADAGMPLDQLQAAAADPTALGLPAYANGTLEGFLFPATYDVEPGDTATGVLSQMVAGTVAVLDELQVPDDQRLGVLTEASIVQAEAGSVEDMGKVARVLDNRMADGMPLQLDTTVNYANGKSGVTTTNEDRQNPSPYNTYVHTGLPPGAISNPGEEAIRAVLNPTPGDWRFFVVVNPDTGETRFAVSLAEHNQNVLLFQQWLQDNPGN